MKHIYLFCSICILYSSQINGQTQWFEPGMKLNYMADPGFTSDYGRADAEITLAGDTVINNISYKLLTHQQITPNNLENRLDTTYFPNIIVRQEGNKIYHLIEGDDEWLLYDFDAEVGDTLDIRAVVMSTDSIEHNGQYLKTQTVNFLCQEYATGQIIPSNITVTFIELYGYPNFPFLYYDIQLWGCSLPSPEYGHHSLKCYSDNSYGGKLFFGTNCGLEPSTSSLENTNAPHKFKITKSPSYISITSDHIIKEVQIINYNGQKISVYDGNLKDIPLAHFTTGLYIIRLISDNNTVYTEKFFHGN